MRYDDLSDSDLQKKAEEAGVKNAGSLSRKQLITKLAEKGDTGEGKKSDFVTPVTRQGLVPSGADDVEREPAKDNQPQSSGEFPPAKNEKADQSSLGGTGGTTVSGIGDSGTSVS